MLIAGPEEFLNETAPLEKGGRERKRNLLGAVLKIVGEVRSGLGRNERDDFASLTRKREEPAWFRAKKELSRVENILVDG